MRHSGPFALKTTIRESRHGAMSVIRDSFEVGVDHRDQVLCDDTVILFLPIKRASHDTVVRDHDERLSLAIGDKIVHYLGKMSLLDPTVLILSASRKQIQHGITFGLALVIAGRCVYIHTPHGLFCVGPVADLPHLPVRHIPDLIYLLIG